MQTQLIEIGYLQSKLREQAIRDTLTNLFNRRYLEETLERELARAAREDYSVCVIMIDLDHFKRVNDTYGHEAGDDVLRLLGAALRESLRDVDLAARYGGEEFAIILPETDASDGLAVAEKIRKRIESTAFQWRGSPIAVTISAGVAALPHVGWDNTQLVRNADAALYTSKRSGRNRVTMAR